MKTKHMAAGQKLYIYLSIECGWKKGRRTRIKREVGLVFGSDCSWCILAFARTVLDEI